MVTNDMEFGEAPFEIIDGDRGKNYPNRGDFLGAGHCLFLSATNVTKAGFDFSDCLFIDEKKDAALNKGKLCREDIVLTTRGTVGNTAFFKPSVPYEHLRINSGMVILRCDRTKLLPAFLYHFVRSPSFHEQVNSLRSGVAQPQLPIRDMRRIRLPVPPLPVQRRISGILSAYDELIENSQRRIRLLEDMARALYREWFVHFRFPGHESVPRRPSALGDIPQGWAVKKLGEVATITMGLSPKGDTYNDQGDGTPLVNGPVEFGERFTKQVKWTTAPTKLCHDGDLVVCVRGSTTGKYVKSDGTYCLGRGVCGMSSTYQAYVDLLFQNELPLLLGQTSGSTFPSWTGPQLQSHPVLSPPPKLLERFEEIVKPMSGAIAAYARRIDNLRRTRDLLLPRLLSGQVALDSSLNSTHDAA